LEEDPPPPRNKWALTPEALNLLLSWLHPDRDQAGLKYQEIREKMIKRFMHLGCPEPEELANRTMDRVARKLPKIIDTYEGEREPYFYSVAYFIYREYLRELLRESLVTLRIRDQETTSIEELVEKELLDSCLKHCLDKLDPESREMILEYYRGRRQVKIKARKALAERLGITLPALRLRAQRVRSGLRKCMLDCMERKARERH
jgi:DNA-directed RNA polymerase specialized sigma24 family protein